MSTQQAQPTSAVKDSARENALWLIVLGVFLYSTGPVMLQASSVSGPVFAFWRLWIGVAVLGAAALMQARRMGGWPGRRSWRWAVWGGLAFGVHQLLFLTAVKLTTVADVTLMNTIAPVVTAIGAAYVFGEHPGPRFHLWTVLAVAGAGVVAVGGSTGPSGDPLGMLMAAVNVVFFAAFFLLSKKGRDHLPVLPFLLGVMLVAALFVSAYALLAGEPVLSATGTDYLLAAAVAAGPGAVGHFVMTWPLRWVPANIPPVMRLAQPVISGLLAWWLLSEPITATHLIGGAIVIGGVCGAILSRSGRQMAREARGRPDGEPSKRRAAA